MSATVVKITFPEFKKFLEAAAEQGRVADCWTVQSNDPAFNVSVRDNHPCRPW